MPPTPAIRPAPPPPYPDSTLNASSASCPLPRRVLDKTPSPAPHVRVCVCVYMRVCFCVHVCVCACVCVRACVYTSVQGVCLLPLTCVRCGIALYARSPRMKAIAVTVAVHPSPQHAHNYHTRFCLNVKSSCIKWSCRSVAPISLQDAAVTAAVDAILHSSVSALSNMFSHL